MRSYTNSHSKNCELLWVISNDWWQKVHKVCTNTYIMSLGRPASVIGNTPCTSLYCLILPIAVSAWIRSPAILLVCSTSVRLNCCLLFPRKGGMLMVMPSGVSTSSRSKPLSAIMLSPASKSSSSPDDFVMALSETRPPHKSNTNVITPPELIPTKSLKVLWLL